MSEERDMLQLVIAEAYAQLTDLEDLVTYQEKSIERLKEIESEWGADK